MTIKELAKTARCGIKTVRRFAKSEYPAKIVNGKETDFTEEEALHLMELLPKRNLVQPRPNDQGIEKLANSIMAMAVAVTRLCDRQESQESRIAKLEKRPLQIEFQQDYFSILGYCNLKKIQLPITQAMRYGKVAARMTKERGLDVRKIPDERFGTVGSYPVEVLNEVFEI